MWEDMRSMPELNIVSWSVVGGPEFNKRSCTVFRHKHSVTGLFNAFVPFSCSQAGPSQPHNYLNQLIKDHLSRRLSFELSLEMVIVVIMSDLMIWSLLVGITLLVLFSPLDEPILLVFFLFVRSSHFVFNFSQSVLFQSSFTYCIIKSHCIKVYPMNT